jgi:hypothetical protein
MVVVFSWRRVQIERSIAGVRGRGGEVGEVPKLWDLWSNEMTERMEGGEIRWDSVKVRVTVQGLLSLLHEFILLCSLLLPLLSPNNRATLFQ